MVQWFGLCAMGSIPGRGTKGTKVPHAAVRSKKKKKKKRILMPRSKPRPLNLNFQEAKLGYISLRILIFSQNWEPLLYIGTSLPLQFLNGTHGHLDSVPATPPCY